MLFCWWGYLGGLAGLAVLNVLQVRPILIWRVTAMATFCSESVPFCQSQESQMSDPTKPSLTYSSSTLKYPLTSLLSLYRVHSLKIHSPTYSPSMLHSLTVQSRAEVSSMLLDSTSVMHVTLSTWPLHAFTTANKYTSDWITTSNLIKRNHKTDFFCS